MNVFSPTYQMTVCCLNCHYLQTIDIPKGTTYQEFKRRNEGTKKCYSCECPLFPLFRD